MKKILLACLVIAHFAGRGTSTALAESPRAVEVTASELHPFQTKDGTSYEIYVAFPLRYEADGDAKYPILYMTDASGFFALFAQTMRALELEQELPPMILVGVDKPSGSLQEALMSRFIYLTPTRDSDREQELSRAFGRDVQTGGADTFLAALTGEIVPWVEARYPASGVRGLAGYSLGGLFATHVLLTSPGSFTHYLLGSPSLYWDDEVMFDREKAYCSEHRELAARVFLSVGADEVAEHVGRVLRFAETLESRKYSSLEVERHVFQDETHVSGIAPTVSRGLVKLFGGH